MKMTYSIPALPVSDISQSIAFYRDMLGFTLVQQDGGSANFRRDSVDLHLWEVSDQSWRARSAGTSPILTGAESFIAGTASCRIAVEGVDDLYSELQPRGVVYPHALIADKYWGTREFTVVDPDYNGITFFELR